MAAEGVPSFYLPSSLYNCLATAYLRPRMVHLHHEGMWTDAPER